MMYSHRNINVVSTRFFMYDSQPMQIEGEKRKVTICESDMVLLQKYIDYLNEHPEGVEIVKSMRFTGINKRWKSYIALMPYLEQVALVWQDEKYIGILK